MAKKKKQADPQGQAAPIEAVAAGKYIEELDAQEQGMPQLAGISTFGPMGGTEEAAPTAEMPAVPLEMFSGPPTGPGMAKQARRQTQIQSAQLSPVPRRGPVGLHRH